MGSSLGLQGESPACRSSPGWGHQHPATRGHSLLLPPRTLGPLHGLWQAEAKVTVFNLPGVWDSRVCHSRVRNFSWAAGGPGQLGTRPHKMGHFYQDDLSFVTFLMIPLRGGKSEPHLTPSRDKAVWSGAQGSADPTAHDCHTDPQAHALAH